MKQLFTIAFLLISTIGFSQNNYYSTLMIDYDHGNGNKRSKKITHITFEDPKEAATSGKYQLDNAPTGTLTVKTTGGIIYFMVVKYVQTVRGEDIYSIVYRNCNNGEDLIKWDALTVRRGDQIVGDEGFDTTFKLAITSQRYYDPSYYFTAIYSNKNEVRYHSK